MKYEDFISKLNELHVNLTNQLESKHNSIVSLQNEVVEKLMNNIIQEKEGLSQIEASLFQNEEEKNQHISSLKAIITHLKSELENELHSYKSSYNVKAYQENLISQKEENLSSLTNPKKKEIENLKQKINTLDRECLLNLKAKAVEFEEEEKNLTAKLTDLEKRLKFEIQKINDAILIPMKDDTENTESQAITNLDEIKAYRLKGLNDILNLKLKYCKDVKKAKLNFNVYQSNFQRENDIIREEYNLKIEELKYIINKRQIELQTEYDIYDLECFIKSNQYEKDFQNKYNNIKKEYQKKVVTYQDNIIKADLEKNNIRSVNTNSILCEIKEIDLNQLKDLKFINDDYDSAFFEVTASLISVLDIYQVLLENFINEFWLVYNNYLKRFSNLLIMNKYNSYALNKFTYDKNYDLINNSISNFVNLEKQKLNEYINMINNWFKDLNKKVYELHQMHLRHQKMRDNQFKDFIKGMTSLINQAKEDGLDHQKTYSDEATKLIEQKKSAYKVENDIYLADVNNDDKIANEKYIDINKKLNDNIEQLKQNKIKLLEKIKIEYQQNINTIKENISKIKVKTKRDLKTKEKQIQQKYETEIREIENERKTKIKIGLSKKTVS